MSQSAIYFARAQRVRITVDQIISTLPKTIKPALPIACNIAENRFGMQHHDIFHGYLNSSV
jgi:hypothetical protein